MNNAVEPKEVASYTMMTGEIYDLIYSNKNYAAEAERIIEIINQNAKSGGNRVLEAACGTGTYMRLLRNDFDVEGFDLSKQQVEAAKRNLPNLRIKQADLIDFDMGKTYDAVLCLFSSIGYVLTIDNLQKSVKCMANHTKPGGIIIVEPWLKAEDLIPNHISMESSKNDRLSVQRMGKLYREGMLSIVSMHHMIGDSNGIQYFVENHELALFSDEDFRQAFEKAGLSFEVNENGLNGKRRICIGKKPI